jgi:hypothetical protein
LRAVELFNQAETVGLVLTPISAEEQSLKPESVWERRENRSIVSMAWCGKTTCNENPMKSRNFI